MEVNKEPLFSFKYEKISAVVSVVILIALNMEFVCLLKYDVLHIINYDILQIFLFFIALIDLREKIIPNKLLYIMAGFRLLLMLTDWFLNPSNVAGIWLGSLTGALTGFLAFGLCYLISKGGMGGGDVKLVTLLGLYLGNAAMIPSMLVIVLCSAIYSVVMLILKKADLKREIPFAPFIYIGTVISMAMGMGI